MRLWKIELQKLADKLGLAITVHHLPPGTSKWNKIEHRLFSFITGNWRGKPLISHQVIVQLIAATTTKAGLTVRCELDPNIYPAGIKTPIWSLSYSERCESGSHGNTPIGPEQPSRYQIGGGVALRVGTQEQLVKIVKLCEILCYKRAWPRLMRVNCPSLRD